MIRGKRDLQFNYSMIRFLEKTIEENRGSEDIRKTEDWLKEIKRETRAYVNKPKRDVRVIQREFDCWVELYALPEYLTTLEDAAEYFDEYEWIHAEPSQYDCTGQVFTSWRHIFPRNGRFYVYHCLAVDV